MEPEQPARVVVIDDHPAILAGVQSWYAAADPPITVVAAGPDLAAAWTEPGRTAPVVVLDLHLGGAAPVYGDLGRLVKAGKQVIVYTMRDDTTTPLTCLDIGAFTYLTKAEGPAHLVAATHAAAAGRPFVSPSLAGAIALDRRQSRPPLSEREIDVLLAWFRCESKEMVGEKLSLSPRTVASYIDRVRCKYANSGRSAPTKAALVARALQDGLVSLDEL